MVGSCRLIARYRPPSRMPYWVWWPLVMYRFTYDPFKRGGSFKWLSDVGVENANLDTFLPEEMINMAFDLEANSIYIFKGIGYY